MFYSNNKKLIQLANDANSIILKKEMMNYNGSQQMEYLTFTLKNAKKILILYNGYILQRVLF